MNLLSRLTFLLLSLLLVTQTAWPSQECVSGKPGMNHQEMESGHHGKTPSHGSHHSSCLMASCVSTSCAPTALHTQALSVIPVADALQARRTQFPTVSPAGPHSPEPPPPRV